MIAASIWSSDLKIFYFSFNEYTAYNFFHLSSIVYTDHAGLSAKDVMGYCLMALSLQFLSSRFRKGEVVAMKVGG